MLKFSGPIQLRGKTAAQFTAENPVLAEREEAVETDTGYKKRGPGAWNSLAYLPETRINRRGGVAGVDSTALVPRSGAAINPSALVFQRRAVSREVAFADPNFPVFTENFLGTHLQSLSVTTQNPGTAVALTNGTWSIASGSPAHWVGTSVLGLIGPFFFASIAVKTITNSERIGIGVCSGTYGAPGTNQIVANYDGGNVYMYMSGAGGTLGGIGSTAYTPATGGFDLGLLVNGSSKTLLTRDFGSTKWVTRCSITNNTCDARDAAILSTLRPYVLRVGTATCVVSNLAVSYLGGVGSANFSAIAYKDGTPLQRGNKLYFCGSRAGLTDSTDIPTQIAASYFAIWEFDITKLTVVNTAKLFFKRTSDGLIYGENAGAVLWDDDTLEFLIYAPTWGRQTINVTSVQTLLYRTKDNILHGVHQLLDTGSLQLNFDATHSNYDPAPVWDAAANLWRMAITQTTPLPITAGWVYVMTFYTSPDQVTWTKVGVSTDAYREGNKVLRIGGANYFVSANGNASTGYFDFFDPVGNFIGEIITDIPSYNSPRPHPCIFAAAQGGKTRMLLVSCDGALYGTQPFSEGNIIICEAAQTQLGYEAPRKFPVALL